MIQCIILLFCFITLPFSQAQCSDAASSSIIYHYYPDSDGSPNLHYYGQEKFDGTEQCYWSYEDITNDPILISKVWRDHQGNPIACRLFEYDDKGSLIKASLYGNLSGSCPSPLIITEDGYPFNNGVEYYSTHWSYSYQDETLWIQQSEDNGKRIDFIYDPSHKHIIAELTGNGVNIIHRRFFEYNKEGLLASIIIDDGCNADRTDLQHVHERHQIVFTYVSHGTAAGQVESILEQYLNLHKGKYITTSLIMNAYTDQGKLQSRKLFDGSGHLLDTKEIENGLGTIEIPEPPADRINFANTPDACLYNVRGSPIKCTYWNGTTEQFVYYLDGTLKAMTDRLGNTTTYERDFLGRPTAIRTTNVAGNTSISMINVFDSFHLIEYFCSDGDLHYSYKYDYQGNLADVVDHSKLEKKPQPQPKPEEDTKQSTWSWLWKKACGAGRSFADKVSSAKNYLNSVKKDLSYSEYIKEDTNALLESVFSQGFLQFAGYYQDASRIGVYNPGHEKNDKVRITLINGILTIMKDLDQTLEHFSKAHGDNTIHYVFRSTEGWTNDLFAASLSKMGRVSPHARLLAELWKGLIKEMGGPNGGGVIIHYAHSIGATETFDAKKLLDPHERSMIHVVTMGSPTLIPDNAGFANVVNYVSKRDLVCLLDLRGYINGILANNGNVRFLGSFFDSPPLEHTLTSPSYAEIIVLLGEQFMETHKE